jgi:retron-type reverse transcriptase
LAQNFDRLKKETPGVDGVCCADYQENLKENVSSLHARLVSGAQRALPAKLGVYTKGSRCLCDRLGIVAVEGKALQLVVADILERIYEEDFLIFSYGV